MTGEGTRPVCRRRRRGYTFIEMVACLVIICLIAAVLLPIFARGREAARRTSCLSNLRQMGEALHLYAQDYSGRFPPAHQDWSPTLAYTKNLGVYACPSEPRSSLSRYGVYPGGSSSDGPVFSSYQYRGGLTNDTASTTIVAADWASWHFGRRNLLYLGGDVRWEQEPTGLLAPTPRPLPSAPARWDAPSGPFSPFGE